MAPKTIMEALREDIQTASDQFDDRAQEGSEKTFQGLIVGIALGMFLWTGVILVWLVL